MKAEKKLARKLIIGFIVVGILLCGLSIFFGYGGFLNSIERQYHDMAYLIADTAQDQIAMRYTAEELLSLSDAAKAAETAVTEEERYRETRSALDRLRKNMQLTDIYVVTYSSADMRDNYREGDADWKPLCYLFDCYEKEEEALGFGERSSMNADNRILFAEVVEQGKPQEAYIISDGAFGYNISALQPVLTADGKVAAVIGVEMPMRRVEEATRSFVTRTVLSMTLMIVLIIVIFVGYLYRGVVRPINTIASEVRRFGESNNRTDESKKKLRSIRTGDEVEALAGHIDQMERDLLEHMENIRRVTADKERISAELNVANQIQADMLPRIFPAFPGRDDFEIYATMTPAKEVGGDFYDYFLVDDDHLALVMADVSGKGVPAALFMVIAKTVIKNRALNGGSPAEILHDVNNQLCEGNQAMLFVTVWFAIIELSTGKGLAANAGHEHPVIRRKDGLFALEEYDHDPPLAAMEDLDFAEHPFELHPGDELYIYTDGVPEAINREQELFGTERMIDALNSADDETGAELLSLVKETIDDFAEETEQFDDITMLLLTYYGKKTGG